MPLRRVDTTFGLPEAHIIAGFLRAEGIDAFVFDTDFIRQDWFEAIAFGGYRVLVRDDDMHAARTHIRTYRDTKTTLSQSDDPPCPACNSTTYRDDVRPRRWVFAVYIALQVIPFAIFIMAGTSAGQGFIVGIVMVAATALLALAAIVYLKRRYVCDQCGHRWRDPLAYRHSMTDEVTAAPREPPG